MALCRWCGGTENQHEIRFVDGAQKLVGMDGHLFQAQVWPLRAAPPASRTAERAALLRAQGGEFEVFNELKTADLKTLSVERLVALAAFGAMYREAGEALGVPCEWIDGRIKQIHTAIALTRSDEIRARLDAITTEENKLKTDAERRVELTAERSRLERLLASSGSTTASGA